MRQGRLILCDLGRTGVARLIHILHEKGYRFEARTWSNVVLGRAMITS